MDPLDTEVRVIPDDSEEIQRGLIAVNSPDGDIMWGDPDLNEDDDWKVVTPKAKMKGSGHHYGPPEIQESNKTTPQMKTKRFHHA